MSIKSKIFYDKTITDKFMKYNALFNIDGTNRIEFYNGDFLRQRWNNALIIFVNSTCFSNDLMDKIGIKAMTECEVDSIIITISKKINNFNNDWELKNVFKRAMSWGIGSIYIYIRNKKKDNI